MGGSDYDVFVSYARSVSTPLAVALQRELERFAKKWNQVRALRVFRDDSSMSASPSLWSSIEAALTTSKYFILIATPESAASEYVDQEARWWVTHKGADSILVVLAGGKLDWSDAAGGFTPDSSVPPALQRAFAEEPRWIDMTWFDDPDSAGNADPRFQERVADLAAPVRGVDRDALIGANLKEHRKTMRRARIAIAALSTLLVAALVAGGVAVTRGNTAKRLFADAVGQRIAPEAAQMLNGEIPGGLGRGLQEILVAQQLKTNPDPGAYLNAMIRSAAIEKIATTVPAGSRATVSATLNLIATGSSAGDIQIWDFDLKPVGLPIQTGSNSYPQAFSHDGNLLATGNAIGVVELWDLRTRIRKGSMQVATTKGPEQAFVDRVVFTPDDNGLVVRTGDNAVGFYETETLRQTAPAIPNTAWLTAPADGNIIAVAPLRGSAVEIRNPWTGKMIGEPLTASGSLAFRDCRSFDAAGNHLLIGQRDTTTVLDLKTRAIVHTKKGGCGFSTNYALSLDGALILQADESQISLGCVDCSRSDWSSRLISSGKPFIGVRWLDDQRALALTPNEMFVFVVDRRESQLNRDPIFEGGFWSALEFGAPADVIVVGAGSAVTIYRGANALPPITASTLVGVIADSVYTFSDEDGTWDEWSLQDGSHKRGWPVLLKGDNRIRGATIGTDLRNVVVLTDNGNSDFKGGTLRRWNLATGQLLGEVEVPDDLALDGLPYFDGIRATGLARSGPLIGGRASVWSFDLDAGTANIQHAFTEPVAAIAGCRDSGGAATWMIVWQNGRVGFVRGELAENLSWKRPPVVAHTADTFLGAVSLSPDCRTGASWPLPGSTVSGSLQFWDAESGNMLADPVTDARIMGWSADGRAAIDTLTFRTDIPDGTRIIRVRPTAADLCAKLVANMSRKQWDEWISPDLEYQKACPELPIAPDE
ncbi:Toll/interleukin-1 receptor homology (TIR) domain containing protein [Mycobacteriaceae bacterium]